MKHKLEKQCKKGESMSSYNDYMDSIEVDTALHEKIVEKQKAVSHNKNKIVSRYVAAAACIAVLIACMRVMSLNNDNLIAKNDEANTVSTNEMLATTNHIDIDINQNTTINADESVQQYKSRALEQTTSQEEQTSIAQLHKLTLNKADSQISASIAINGHFWYSLTDEQIQAIFPKLNIAATVNYTGDGSIFNVVAYEVTGSGDEAKYMDLYPLTTIQLSPNGIIEDVIYEYDAQTSNVYGTFVTAGVFYGNEKDGVALYVATFEIDGISYSVKLHDSDRGDNGLNRLTQTVNSIIQKGTADISVLNNPIIPELRDELLTLESAHLDDEFGEYVPDSIPVNFKFDTAHRLTNQSNNALFMHWNDGHDYIDWRISMLTDYERERIVYADEKEKYDMSLYSIPLADSVSDDLREYVYYPVFKAEQLSLEVVRARAYRVDDKGDTDGFRMNFGVLYGDDVVVYVNIKGATPEQVFDLFIK